MHAVELLNNVQIESPLDVIFSLFFFFPFFIFFSFLKEITCLKKNEITIAVVLIFSFYNHGYSYVYIFRKMGKKKSSVQKNEHFDE